MSHCTRIKEDKAKERRSKKRAKEYKFRPGQKTVGSVLVNGQILRYYRIDIDLGGHERLQEIKR